MSTDKPHKVKYSAIGFTEDGNYVNVRMWGDIMDIRSEGHETRDAAEDAAKGLFGQDKRVAWVGICESHQRHEGGGWYAGPQVMRVNKDGSTRIRAVSQVLRWLRNEPGVWREAARIAENPHNEFEYGDQELAAAMEVWLFDYAADSYLTKELGASLDLRNKTALYINRDEFYEISWDKVREILMEEDGPEG